MYTIRSKIFTITLILLIPLSGVYFLYSKIISVSYERLRLENPENEILALAERWNQNFILILALVSIIMILFAFFIVLKLTSKTSAKENEKNEMIATELSVAAEIQTSMLPSTLSYFHERSEFNISAYMHSAKQVGGDFYDYFMIDRDNLAVLVADVSGKGVPAALFMVITKILIKSNACSGKSPGEVLEIVNNTLCENNDSAMFVTVFMGYYNVTNGRFVYSNAGHNPPLVRKNGNDYDFLKIKTNIVLGFMENVEYQEEEVFLEPGDSIYMYTDGVTETMNAERMFFSEERLLETLNNHKDYPPRELLSTIKNELDYFSGYFEQTDDITMLALEIEHFSLPEQDQVEPARKLVIEADAGNLNEVINFIHSELNQNNCPPELFNHIELAVEEIFINIAKYAYSPQKGDVAISITTGDEIQLRFEDSGMPYNPLEQADPDLNIPLMERDLGGLGIYLFRNVMDEIRYSRIDGKNILTVVKKIK